MNDIINKMCSQLREDYYVNDKNLLREQDEETSEQGEDQEIKTFDNKSEQAKNFINNIKNYLNNGAVSFDSIVFDPKDNRFTWEGEIATQVKWEFVFEDGKNPQVFFKIEEPQDLDKETTLAMHKLNTYFREKISAEISTAIQNKQFENIAQNNPG
jgi:hypothetical protein